MFISQIHNFNVYCFPEIKIHENWFVLLSFQKALLFEMESPGTLQQCKQFCKKYISGKTGD